jgi:AraC family transcriptional regulator of adaptative response/methylated-DNA-[protein]-cysteine methyltransferase
MLSEKNNSYLTSSLIETTLGTMIAIADTQGLCFLDFIDRKQYDEKIALLMAEKNAPIVPGTNLIINLITQELNNYFAGTLHAFTTPIAPWGSHFQNKAWKALQEIPYGTTITYAKQAIMTGNEKATRAVAHANSNNTLSIIIPCHRVISSNGKLCGYAGGLNRKEWLIKHEKANL